MNHSSLTKNYLHSHGNISTPNASHKNVIVTSFLEKSCDRILHVSHKKIWMEKFKLANIGNHSSLVILKN